VGRQCLEEAPRTYIGLHVGLRRRASLCTRRRIDRFRLMHVLFAVPRRTEDHTIEQLPQREVMQRRWH